MARALDHEGITRTSFVATMLQRVLEVRGDRPAPASLALVLLGVVAAGRSSGSRVLLCTDGLTEHLSNDQLTAALAQKLPARTIAKQLVEQALKDRVSENTRVIAI